VVSTVGHYFADLSAVVGARWNAFWFRTRAGWHLELMRILLGTITLVWLGSFTRDLVRWFGKEGMFPGETIYRVLTGGDPSVPVYGQSHLFYLESPTALAVAHAVAILVVLLFTLGIVSRLTGPATAAVALAYVHRAPLVTGPFETVLTMLLLYLCLAPTGRVMALGRVVAADANRRTLMANIATRLMQVHLAALYVMTGLTKLGHLAWWTGDATWHLMAQSEFRLIDVTFLRRSPLVLDGLTHAWVLFDLLYGVLIWNRWARPLLLLAACVVWTGAALLTGRVGLAAVMVVANLAFVPPAVVAGWYGAVRSRLGKNRQRSKVPSAVEHV
jgi:hypothetical protein